MRVVFVPMTDLEAVRIPSMSLSSHNLRNVQCRQRKGDGDGLRILLTVWNSLCAKEGGFKEATSGATRVSDEVIGYMKSKKQTGSRR